ncbi:MAG: hypothetical protein NVS3B21_18390 [Acidimicrobiales bacterium]
MQFLEFVMHDPPRRIALHARFTVIGAFDAAHAIANDLVAAGPAGAHWQGLVDVDGRIGPLGDMWRTDQPLSCMTLRGRDLPAGASLRAAPSADEIPPAPEPTADEGDPGRRARLRRRQAALARALAEPVPDPTPIADALADLVFAQTTARRLAADRRSLAQSWAATLAELAEIDETGAPSPEFVSAAQCALREAVAERDLARRASGVASPERLASLDLVHAELESAEGRARRRFASAAARQRVDELAVAERAILDELGFVSYGDRQLTEALHRPEQEVLDLLERATAKAADAQGVMDEIEQMTVGVERRRALELELQSCRERARTLLLGDVPADGINALLTAPDRGIASAEEALRRLLAPSARSSPDLQAVAEEGLAAIGDALVRREKLEGEWSAVTEELSLLELRRRTTPELPPWATASPTQEEEVGELEVFLLARLVGHRDVAGLGSLPLIIDDALGDVEPAVRRAGLTLLERMGDAVQVVYVTDDPDIHAWARFLGSGRAAVVDAPEMVPTVFAPLDPLLLVDLGPSGVPITATSLPTETVGESDRDHPVAPVEVPPAISARLHCSWCPNQLAAGACAQCRRLLCEDHLFRTAGRKAKVYCVPCGLVAAGVKKRQKRIRRG